MHQHLRWQPRAHPGVLRESGSHQHCLECEKSSSAGGFPSGCSCSTFDEAFLFSVTWTNNIKILFQLLVGVFFFGLWYAEASSEGGRFYQIINHKRLQCRLCLFLLSCAFKPLLAVWFDVLGPFSAFNSACSQWRLLPRSRTPPTL